MGKYDFSEVISCIQKAQKIAVFTHIMPDGDALGSAFALRSGLNAIGKQADCFLEKQLPALYDFFGSDYRIGSEECEDYDLKISVDCGERSRLGIFAQLFCGDTVNIDHHRTREGFADVNIIDEKSASTGEIIYELLLDLNVQLTPTISNALYAAIITDTGGFLFSNTDPKTHRVAAMLMESGADFYALNKRLLQEKSMKQYQLTAHCIDQMKLYMDGRIAVTYLDYGTVCALEVTSDDLDGLSSLPRSISGVEVGALLTELEKGKVKVSLRSDQLVDVSRVAQSFGGGGHMRASGFTWQGGLDELKNKVTEKLTEELQG